MRQVAASPDPAVLSAVVAVTSLILVAASYATTDAHHRLPTSDARGCHVAAHREQLDTCHEPAGTQTRALKRRHRNDELHPVLASYYEMYGDTTACGEVLTPATLGVANRTLPCGTMVTLEYRSHVLRVPVIDRGPYVYSRYYDMTMGTARALHVNLAAGINTVYTDR
jgi:hypothetical protein